MSVGPEEYSRLIFDLREAIAERDGSARKTIALLLRVAIDSIPLTDAALAKAIGGSEERVTRLRANLEDVAPLDLFMIAVHAHQLATTPLQHGIAEQLQLFAELSLLTTLARSAVAIHAVQGEDGYETVRQMIVRLEFPEGSPVLSAGIGRLKRYLALTYRRT